MAANLLKNGSSFVQMVILTKDRHNAPLNRWEATRIEKYIFEQIYANIERCPRFEGGYVFSEDDGAIIINTHVDTVSWLRQVIESYEDKALRITDKDNSPQYTAKVRADVSKLDRKAVDNILDLLEIHNYGLQTDGWRIKSIDKKIGLHYPYASDEVASVTLLIDDAGRKMLERNDFKLFVGFSTITFELLGRVKRSETTGKLCTDDIPSLED